MKIALRLTWLVVAATPLLLAQIKPNFETPEPGTVLLLGTGLVGLGLIGWRRLRK